MQHKADQIRAEIAAISNLLKAGKPDRAFQRAKKVAKKWSDVPAFPRLAGLSAVQQQKPKVAQTYFERAWRLDPTNKELIQNYGLSLVQGGASAEALKFMNKIAARSPLAPDQQFIRALALLRERHETEALAAVDDVLQRAPNDLRAYGLKADILDEMRQWDRALDVLKLLVDKNPKFHFSQLRLAKAYVGIGRMDEGLQTGRVALKLSPLDGETLRFMVKLPNLTDEDVDLLRGSVAKAFESPQSGGRENLGALHFAAAALARRDKDQAQEFLHLEKAHETLTEEGAELEKQRQQECRTRLSRPLPAVEANPRTDIPRPIFVVGLPRSGTTLVERILSAHSSVQGLGELATVRHWANNNELAAGQRQDMGGLADFYADRLPEIARDTVAFVDKMPGNYAYLGDIAQSFPNAVILNVQRDPRDVALSMWREFFGARGLYFTHNFKWMAAEANRYRKYINHWQTVLPGRIHNIAYEDVVRDPEPTIRKLAELCGLSFEEAMLSPQDSSDAVMTASVLQVRNPVNASSVGGWRSADKVLAPFIAGLDSDLWPELSQIEP